MAPTTIYTFVRGLVRRRKVAAGRKRPTTRLLLERLEDRTLLTGNLQLSLGAPTTVASGNQLTYAIMVTNAGPTAAQNVTLSDSVPTGTSYVSQVLPAGASGGLYMGYQVQDSLPTLAAGASATFNVVFLASAGDANNSVLNDTAAVSATGVSSVSVSASTTVQGAQLQTAVSAPPTVASGNQLTYAVTVTNNGLGAAQNVTLTDSVPTGTSYVSQVLPAGASGGLYMGYQVQDSLPSLAAGASATFDVVFLVSAGDANNSVLTDTATASANGTSSSASASTTVQGAHLQVAVVAPAAAPSGGQLTYAITVTNNGLGAAANVTLTDSVPSGTSYVSQSLPAGASGGLYMGYQVQDSLPSLAAGASATFNVVFLVSAGDANNSVLSDTASASANGTSNSASAFTTVRGAILQTVVSAPSTVAAGSPLTYAITVTDIGLGAAQNVTLSDSLPTGESFVSQGETAGPPATLSNMGNYVSDVIANLAAGASATFGVVALISAADANNSVLTDTATASGASSTSSGDQITYVTPAPPPVPAVTSVSPNSGATAGGGAVYIYGSGFTAATSVTFGGFSTGFGVMSATEIEAEAPAHGVGVVNVVVIGPGGASATSSADQYDYLASTTTTLTSSANPSTYGQSITLAVTVSNGTQGAPPTGQVEVLDGGSVIWTATLSNGQATFVTSALAVGGHALSAAYQGDGANATSASNTVNLTVQQAPTTTTLSAGANSSTYGDAVTFTVTVGGNASVAPTGTVQFMQGDTVLGTAELAPGTAGSQAVFTTPYLDPGSQAIQAEYAGDGVNAGSASNILTLTVTPLAPPPVQQAPDGTQYVYEFDGDAGVDQAPVERDDALGRLVQFIDAAGGVTDVSYNDVAGTAAITDPVGDVTTLAPNSQGLLVPQADPSAIAAYGDQGQLTSLTDAGGNVRSFAYDDTGRVFSVTWTDSSGNTRAELGIAYADPSDPTAGVIPPGGTAVTAPAFGAFMMYTAPAPVAGVVPPPAPPATPPAAPINHYPPNYNNASLKKVGIISDFTCASDDYDWIAAADTHTGVSSYRAFADILSTYADNSIDMLVISGHGQAGRCTVRAGADGSTRLIDFSAMPAYLVTLIKAKVKANGSVVLSACNSGVNGTTQVHDLATLLNRTVVGTIGTCHGETADYPHGGYADDGWVSVSP